MKTCGMKVPGKVAGLKKKKVFMMGMIVAIVLILAVYILYRFNYIPHRKYTNADFQIPAYVSGVDQDQDGIDDQTDILSSARAYVESKPKYKSRYYETGYPNDGYGVCTDVVAFGLLGAGYDLMELVNQDIRDDPERYDIETADINIDFRRVRNLKIYFSSHAVSLTTDIYDIDEWQGGDIVVFKKHIGIVSDYRNQKGIPFIIHHASPYQRYYEEDILENRKDIVGHYRISGTADS